MTEQEMQAGKRDVPGELDAVVDTDVNQHVAEIPMFIIESADFQQYMNTVNSMAADTVMLYKEISDQHAEKGVSLMQICEDLLTIMSESSEPLHGAQTIETEGLVTIALPHNTPFTRLQRAMTVASMMSGEAILPQMTLIDAVSTMAATTLVKSQEAYKQVVANKSAKKRGNSRQRRKAKQVH